MTYDTAEKLASFGTRRQIEYPMLADPDSQAIRAFGVLNQAYPPGSFAHGVAHPIIFVFDGAGTVTRRFSSAGYAHYPEIDQVLAELRKK